MSHSDWEHGVQVSPPLQLCDLGQVTYPSEFQFLPLETGGQKTNLSIITIAASVQDGTRCWVFPLRISVIPLNADNTP